MWEWVKLKISALKKKECSNGKNILNNFTVKMHAKVDFLI